MFCRLLIRLCVIVSLFTREWIEIVTCASSIIGYAVSLFTREWIEIVIWTHKTWNSAGLPLYEGVD